MIISKEFGPQFDRSDGTIGALQLVKRFVIVGHDGWPWYPRQGQYTWTTRQKAQTLIDKIAGANQGLAEQNLQAVEWWCYPGHFDPAYSVEEWKPEKKPRDLKSRVIRWLLDNQSAIASRTGYPGAFHQQMLFDLVTPQSQVAFLRPERPGERIRHMDTGRVQILTRGSHAAVLVTGSSGARPALVDARNIVWCDKAPKKL